jgi:hypothetical protein
MEHNNPNPLLSKAHLTKLNVSNLKMIEAMGLKLLHRGLLEYHYLPTKFHENLPSGSKVITGRQTPFWSHRCHLHCHQLHTKFHPYPPVSSNAIWGSLHPPQKFKRPPFWND